MRHLVLYYALISAGLAVGCNDDPNGPGDLAGEYGLVQANGQSLPLLEPPAEGNTVTCDTWLVDGTLRMEAAGTFAMVIVYQWDCTNFGGSVSTYESSFAGSYTLSGRSLSFSFVPPISSDVTGSFVQ